MEQSKNLREPATLDDVDRQIIGQLQLNGRMTNAELAERVGIAPSTCVARVRSLVSRRIITGFTAAVEVFCNRERLHSTLDYCTPAEVRRAYERREELQTAVAA